MRNVFKKKFLVFVCLGTFFVCFIGFFLFSFIKTERFDLTGNQKQSSALIDNMSDADEEIQEPASSNPTKPKALQIPLGEKLLFLTHKTYMIMFDLTVTSESGTDKRRQLITKYDPDSTPPVGWGIALRKTPASTRMEFYLNDGKTPLGWMPFGSIQPVRNEKKTYFLIFTPGDFVSLYSKNPAISKQIEEHGVYAIKEIGDIQSRADLLITSGSVQHNSFKSVIENINILSFKQFSFSKKEFLKFLQKNSDEIRFNEQVICLLEVPSQREDCTFRSN